jgi:hypothetical protein
MTITMPDPFVLKDHYPQKSKKSPWAAPDLIANRLVC